MKIIHNNLQEIINFHPHEIQQEIIRDNSRFKILNAGRRFGKSLLGAYLATYQALQSNQRIWVVAPTNILTEKIWRELYSWFIGPLNPMVEQIYGSRGNLRLITKTGSFIECKSADDPTGLIGEGLDLLIMDEASRIKEIAWREALRPTLSDRMGKSVAISTPKGSKNWYYQDYRKGTKGEDGYKSWNMPTNTNPFFPKDEWEQLTKELGVDNPIFRQEFLAEFIDDVGAVFRNIHSCIGGDFEEPKPNIKYSIGIDLAKTMDYTVKMVIRHDTRQIVYMERYNQVPYDEQINKIISLSKRYNNANILIDSTGVGDPVFDILKKQGVNVKPYKFTNPSKENLVRGLMIALENKEISYPKIDVLIDELEMFEYTLGATGVMRYNAPEGEHDDTVIALALAIKAVEENHSGILDFYKGINEKEETKYNIKNFQQLVY
jgi:hypothetical protein